MNGSRVHSGEDLYYLLKILMSEPIMEGIQTNEPFYGITNDHPFAETIFGLKDSQQYRFRISERLAADVENQGRLSSFFAPRLFVELFKGVMVLGCTICTASDLRESMRELILGHTDEPRALYDKDCDYMVTRARLREYVRRLSIVMNEMAPNQAPWQIFVHSTKPFEHRIVSAEIIRNNEQMLRFMPYIYKNDRLAVEAIGWPVDLNGETATPLNGTNIWKTLDGTMITVSTRDMRDAARRIVAFVADKYDLLWHEAMNVCERRNLEASVRRGVLGGLLASPDSGAELRFGEDGKTPFVVFHRGEQEFRATERDGKISFEADLPAESARLFLEIIGEISRRHVANREGS